MKIPMLHHIIYSAIILGLGVALAVNRSETDSTPKNTTNTAENKNINSNFPASQNQRNDSQTSTRFPGSTDSPSSRQRETRARDVILSMNHELERAGIAIDDELEEEMRRQAERLDRMREWRTSAVLFDMSEGFKLTDRAAQSWGLDDSQRQQLDDILTQNRERLREVEKGLAQKLTDENGNEFYRIPSYSTQKERLTRELQNQYAGIVGPERASLLAKYAPEISSAGEGMRELRVMERRGIDIVEVRVYDNQGNLVARPRWRADEEGQRSERYQHLLSED